MRTNHATLAACVLCLASLAMGCGSGLSKDQQLVQAYLTTKHGPGEVKILKWWPAVDASAADVPGYLAASAKEIEGHLGERGVALVRWASQKTVDKHLEKHLLQGGDAKLVRVRIRTVKLGQKMEYDRLVIVRGETGLVDLPITELSGKEFCEWVARCFPSNK